MNMLLSVIVEAGGFGAVTPASYGMFSRRLPPFEPPRSREEDREILLEELTALGEHAREVGAVVLLEPLNRHEDHVVNNLAAAAELVREVGLPSAAVIGDFFHMSIEESDPAQALRDVAPHLRHLRSATPTAWSPVPATSTGPRVWALSTRSGTTAGWRWKCGLSGPPADVLPRVSGLLKH